VAARRIPNVAVAVVARVACGSDDNHLCRDRLLEDGIADVMQHVPAAKRHRDNVGVPYLDGVFDDLCTRDLQAHQRCVRCQLHFQG
jgi:hypothetical protein